MADNVNQPAHYKVGGIEAIDYIAAKLGNEGFRAYCVGNVLKYASRWQAKNGIEDLRKASVYLCWAINGNPDIKLELSRTADVPPPPLVTLHDGDDEPERSLNFDKAQA
jgi:hypothetical protein